MDPGASFQARVLIVTMSFAYGVVLLKWSNKFKPINVLFVDKVPLSMQCLLWTNGTYLILYSSKLNHLFSYSSKFWVELHSEKTSTCFQQPSNPNS